MKAISVADLSDLPASTAHRLRELFRVENWPDPLDDGLDHAPGEARPINGPLPIELADYSGGDLGHGRDP